MNLLRIVLFAVAALGLVAGIAAPWTGFAAYQSTAWALAGGIVLAALLYDIVTSLARKEVGLDIVAALSMSGSSFLVAVNALLLRAIPNHRSIMHHHSASSRFGELTQPTQMTTPP